MTHFPRMDDMLTTCFPRQLNREFRDLIDSSPAVQYRIDLYSSELEEGTMNDLTPLNHRRKLLESYYSRWNRFDHAREKSLGQPFSSGSGPGIAMGYGHIAYITEPKFGIKDINFVQLSSGSTGGSQKEWVIHGVPCGAYDSLAIHPPSGLLAVLQVVDQRRLVLARRYEIIITILICR